jgi:hypothetical protein
MRQAIFCGTTEQLPLLRSPEFLTVRHFSGTRLSDPADGVLILGFFACESPLFSERIDFIGYRAGDE